MALSSQHLRTTTWALSRGRRRATRRFGGAAVAAASVAAVLAVGSVPATAFAATTVSATANLINNGCLAAPSVTSGFAVFGPAGPTKIPGWSVGGNSVDDVFSNYWQPSPGCSYSVNLSGQAPGSVSQTVDTTPGLYVLRWEMSGNAYFGAAIKTMHVLWDGALVSAPTFMTSSTYTPTAMGWVAKQIIVKATSAKSVVEFADASVPSSTAGVLLGSVSLTAYAQPVNDFTATSANDPYSVAERQMLAKAPGTAVVPASGVPLFTLRAVAADQVQHGAGLGLLIILDCRSLSGQFVHQGSAARLKSAKVVEAYLTGLLSSTRGLYLAALQADRVPLQGTSDLSTWWGVEVRSISTTGSLMTFQIAKTGTTSTITWTNVYGLSSTTNQALAPEALANLLYYSRTVAGGPGSTTATTTPHPPALLRGRCGERAWLGDWSSPVTQVPAIIPDVSMHIATISASVGTVVYPQHNSSGVLALVAVSPQSLRLAEHITQPGPHHCIDGGSISMESVGDGAASWKWTVPSGSSTATATVVRRSPTTTTSALGSTRPPTSVVVPANLATLVLPAPAGLNGYACSYCGPFNLQQYAAKGLSEGPQDVAELATLGFVRGYAGAARNTTNGYGGGVYVFNSASHAADSAAWSVQNANLGAEPGTVTHFAVPEVAEANSLYATALSPAWDS